MTQDKFNKNVRELINGLANEARKRADIERVNAGYMYYHNDVESGVDNVCALLGQIELIKYIIEDDLMELEIAKQEKGQ